jgi:hypothetical protein
MSGGQCGPADLADEVFESALRDSFRGGITYFGAIPAPNASDPSGQIGWARARTTNAWISIAWVIVGNCNRRGLRKVLMAVERVRNRQARLRREDLVHVVASIDVPALIALVDHQQKGWMPPSVHRDALALKQTNKV